MGYADANLNDIYKQMEYMNQNLGRIAELLEMLIKQNVKNKKISK